MRVPSSSRKHPARPRLIPEILDPALPVGEYDASVVPLRPVPLGRDRETPLWSHDPRLDPVDEHEPLGGRFHGREEQRVIAPGADEVRRPGRKSAAAIRLQPFERQALLNYSIYRIFKSPASKTHREDYGY